MGQSVKTCTIKLFLLYHLESYLKRLLPKFQYSCFRNSDAPYIIQCVTFVFMPLVLFAIGGMKCTPI